MSTATQPAYRTRIVKVTDLRVGDIIKSSRRTITKIDASGNTWPPFEGRAVTAFYLKGSNTPHVWFNDRRITIYRTDDTATGPRHYPVRIAQDGTKIRKGGSGPWYVYDSATGEIPVWVSHTTKRSAQMAADARNTPATPARHLTVVR